MILRIHDWEFDLDLTRTMEYSAVEVSDHCTCAYCRNFYASVDEFYPNLRPFLAKFGIDIEAPDEQIPYDDQLRMYYDSVYLVAGRILRQGTKPILIDDAVIQPMDGNGPYHALAVDQDFASPCFVLDVRRVILPWILDESMEETISPANELSFLEKILDRLLENEPENQLQ